MKDAKDMKKKIYKKIFMLFMNFVVKQSCLKND